METNRIRQFCTVAETENLRKAAEILAMSHSALSKSLKVLQAEINQTLLIQSGRNIVVTDEGKAFYRKALDFLNQEQQLLEKDRAGTERLKIGTFEVFSTHLLGTYWKQYFSETELDLYEMLPGKLEQALAQNEIDFAITYEPIAMKGIEYVQLGKIEMGIYARSDVIKTHPSFQDLPFVAPISPIEGTPSGTKGLDGWPDHVISRKVLYRVDMMESGLSLARQGIAAIFIPHFVAKIMNQSLKNDFQLKPIALPKKIKPVVRSVYLMRRSNQIETKQLRTLAKLIRSECF